MFQFSKFSSSFLIKFVVFAVFLTSSLVSNSALPIFAQNTNQNISNSDNQNARTINLVSTSVPQNQKPFIYYFPYQTDGQNTKINASLVSKKGDGFSFIPSESVIFNFVSGDLNKQNECRSFTGIRKPIDSSNFDSKKLTNYSFPFGEISSLGKNDGCVGMKIKVMENAQIGDESQIIFENILTINSNQQKITQIGTLKIVEKAGNSTNYSVNSQNSLDNSLQDIKMPDLCSDLPPFENKSDGNISAPNIQAPCMPMPSIPGTKTKTRYSGQSWEFKYNENTKKYETILKNNVDYKNSVQQIGCYNLKELNLNGFGCGEFLEDEIELYVVNYSFIFPINQQTEFQNFYQKQGFTMNPQSQGVQWQVEYYRFKDSNGNFGEWKSYVSDIYHKKPSDYPKFVNYKKAEWIKYEINSTYDIKNSNSIVDL